VRRGTLRCPTLYGSSPFRIARAGRRAEVRSQVLKLPMPLTSANMRAGVQGRTKNAEC
jgi:hypothetical protein